jgi:pimeloyl-ACP methyl ester carboxylesterase
MDSTRTILSYYDKGATPFFAAACDQRLSYCLYVPPDRASGDPGLRPLIVLVHGTERGAARYRDEFAGFAEAHDCIILAPLFPANLSGPGDLDNYKLIEHVGIRFDEVLLSMVDEVAKKHGIQDRFALHGFSGGGHFAHRFFYLHPERLSAVSIGAPGVVTLLDERLPWWTGVADMEERFGRAINYEAMRRVPVQMVVGGDDTETWEITIPEGSSWWMPGANDAGATRIERLRSLQRSFAENGISVRFDLVPEVAHNGWAVLSAVQSFFAEQLEGQHA